MSKHFRQDEKGRTRYERIVWFAKDHLKIIDTESAEKWWKSKPKKFVPTVKTIYIVSPNDAINKIIDELAMMVEEIDEKIDECLKRYC